MGMESSDMGPPSTITTARAVDQSCHASSDIYGSFWIDKTEFAIPVNSVREVVNEPQNMSRVPLAPDYLSGLFNLRGMIIPIIDLRLLLEFPQRLDPEQAVLDRKVAIIENGNKCVGLLFDSAGEVLNEPNSARVDLRGSDAELKDIVIEGALKLDGGRRIVQVIDPFEILKIERVPQADAAEYKKGQKKNLGARQSCVSFQLGHTYCAIDLRAVHEVRDMPPVETSLLSHGFVIGTANLRGDIIPVIDFRSFMGNEAAYKLAPAELAKRKMLVMKSKAGLLGLMVYSIDSILPYYQSEVLPFAKLALPRGNIVKGCLVSEDEHLVMLLDSDLLLSDPGLTEPARICQEVHVKDADEDQQSDVARRVERRTFILFSIANSFAMDTCTVSEVINMPDNLLEPPYALPCVEGIINLRNELITLINLRRLYGLEEAETTGDKVLIFIHKSEKYAIMVDTVDEIVMTTSDFVMAQGSEGFADAMLATGDDVSGVLRVEHADNDPRLVMIMNVGALVARFVGASENARKSALV